MRTDRQTDIVLGQTPTVLSFFHGARSNNRDHRKKMREIYQVPVLYLYTHVPQYTDELRQSSHTEQDER